MITFNNIGKEQESSIHILETPSATLDNPLYEEYYSFNKDYYRTKTQMILNLIDESSSLNGVNKKMLDWMSIGSSSYLRSANDINFMTVANLNNLIEFSKHPDYQPYLKESFYIEEIKVEIPYPPEDIFRKIDSLDNISQADDKRIFKKLINKFHYLGHLPKWFYANTNIETMQQYLIRNMPVTIYDGAYPAEELIPKLNQALIKLRDRVKQSRELVKREARQLDLFEDKINRLRSQKPDKAQIFETYDEVLEIIYYQLITYQRAVMAILGEQLYKVSETVQKMYHDFVIIRDAHKN